MDAAALEDLFAPVGPVHIRRMFGGRGIYADGVMFALEVGGTLYLKTDEASRASFIETGSEPFLYASRGGERQTSYWRLPEDAFDDPDVLARWAGLALRSARSTVRPRGLSSRTRPR